MPHLIIGQLSLYKASGDEDWGGGEARGDEEVWGVWGVWGERFLPHPPTPPTLPHLPISLSPHSLSEEF